MIRGLEVFKNYFRSFSDQYVIIGGAACDIVFSEANSSFRATKDIDMVLIIKEKAAYKTLIKSIKEKL